VSIAEPSGSGSARGDLADRILEAARRLVLRTGARKLSLSDVATLAGVSRPTIYRYFVSKEDLIDALGAHERRRFDAAMERAMSGVTGIARLEAAVNLVATFVEDQPPGRQLDLDPDFAQDQMARALPMISELFDCSVASHLMAAWLMSGSASIPGSPRQRISPSRVGITARSRSHPMIARGKASRENASVIKPTRPPRLNRAIASCCGRSCAVAPSCEAVKYLIVRVWHIEGI